MEGRDKKTVLLFTDWYFPAYKAGGPVQSCYNIVKTLKEHYNFFIITSDRDLGETQPYKGIETGQWINGLQREQIYYAFPGTIKPGLLRRLIRDVGPDVIYFNSMFSLLYTLLPLWILKRMHYSGRVVLAPRGMLHSGALMRKGMKKSFFLRTFWLSGWPGKLQFHATDEQERLDVLRFFPRAKTEVVENIPNIDAAPLLQRKKKTGSLSMIFIARLHPKKNLEFLLQILSNNMEGDIELHVYGSAEHIAYERSCHQLAAKLPANVQVHFYGALQHEQVFQKLHTAHLFVLPTLGENFGHAIFEALSSGMPVLISDQTPWTQLEANQAGWELSLDKPDVFEAKINKMVQMDAIELEQWCVGARRYAESFLRRLDVIARYKSIFR